MQKALSILFHSKKEQHFFHENSSGQLLFLNPFEKSIRRIV